MFNAARKALSTVRRARDRRLDMMILFVTSRCNARCETCFYHDRLNRSGDLTLTELSRLAATMPAFRDLWLSGGEPLLRDDLLDVCGAFIDACGVTTVDLPLNGLLPERSVELAQTFHERFQSTDLYINVALDGLGAVHDRIRAVPGNFDRTEQTLRALAAVRPELPRLKLHVNTVVCSANLHQIEAIGQHVLAEHRVDGHFFQVIRGTAKDPALLDVSAAAAQRVHQFALRIHRCYAERLFTDRSGLEAWFKRASYVGTFATHYAAQAGVLNDGRDWGYPCVAGETAIVVEHDGTVKACELRSAVANLREFDMDFTRLQAAGVLQAEVDDIAARPCPCTHVCFIHTSLRKSLTTLLQVPLRGALKGRS